MDQKHKDKKDKDKKDKDQKYKDSKDKDSKDKEKKGKAVGEMTGNLTTGFQVRFSHSNLSVQEKMNVVGLLIGYVRLQYIPLNRFRITFVLFDTRWRSRNKVHPWFSLMPV